MSIPSSPDELVTRNALRFVEFVYWVLTASGGIVLALAVPAFAVGDGLLSLKYALFVVGFLLFGVGSFAIQPSPRGRGPLSRLFSLSVDGTSQFGFERRIQQVPPLDGESLPVADRVSRDVKVFVASLVLLGVSFVLEVGFDVAVG
ncbi:DUF7555 family protein [Halorhabdus amylolytica]|uniref:DUF7555 family protein n=1 Tax=Halorhabdus amylolytica TaxID=2559573 RepID=UPI0010AA71E5|nr:hypothetical protein [Halorhabdus amylolytica]